MARSDPLISSFNAGETSPRLAARTDFVKYPNSLKTAVNVIPLAEGALMRRAASRYIATVKDSAAKTYLRPFVFNTVQAYILEFGNNYIRFYRNQGQIIVADTNAVVTNGQFGSNINDWDDRSTSSASIAHDSTNGRLNLVGASASKAWAEQDITTSDSSVEMNLKFEVIGAPSDTVKLNIGTSSTGTQINDSIAFEPGFHCKRFTPTASPFYVQFHHSTAKTIQIDNVSLTDDAGVEIGSPWTTAQIPDLAFAQTADVMYISHPDVATYRLSRDGHSSWRLEIVSWDDGPYLDENTTATTFASAATTGLGITITASATAGINGGDGFKSTDVGRILRIAHTTNEPGWAIITTFTDTTHVVVDIIRDFNATTAATTWRLGSWSGTTGYPRAISFFEQRLSFAGTTNQPQTFWLSQSGDIENMRPDSFVSAAVVVENDDALDFTLAADEINSILWLSASSRLIMGTLGGEWVASSDGVVMTPSDVTASRRTAHGSKASVSPVRVGDSVLFTQRAGRKVREFSEIEFDLFRAPDMTRLAQHITVGGILEMAYQQEPDSLVWAVRNDGQLLSMTFRRDEDVVGWARHILGGSFSTGDAVVDSVAVIPGNNGSGQTQDSTGRDEVWITVKRTINSATVRYVEVLERDFETGDDQEDSYYADSIITYDSTSTTSITGLGHLEGQVVKVFADGAIQTDKTVVSSAITIDVAASVVQIGLGFTHTITPLKFEGGTQAGTAVGKTKQVFAVTFLVLNSHTLSFGPDTSNLRTIDFRVISDAMDTAVPFFTGERREEWDDDWARDPRITIQSSDPVPFTLLGLAPELDVKELS